MFLKINSEQKKTLGLKQVKRLSDLKKSLELDVKSPQHNQHNEKQRNQTRFFESKDMIHKKAIT